MDTNSLLLINGVLIAFCIILFIGFRNACNVRLNMGFVSEKNYQKMVESPKIKIVKVELVYSCNSFDKVAKYYCESWYKQKKDVDVQRFVFYDAVGKYSVNDELELVKTN